MNWLFIGLPLLAIYIIWFGYLIIKRKYHRALLFFALAHVPYLLFNLVAPFRGILDPDYAGYSFGLVTLPKGFSVALVVGTVVVISFLLATKALQNKMEKWWKLAFGFDILLTVFFGIPVLWDILTDLQGFRVELGEYLQISGIFVAFMVFVLVSGPTLFACYYAGKKTFARA